MPNRNLELRQVRREYADTPLRRAMLAEDPMVQLRQWLEAAQQAGVRDPSAMTLATVDRFGQPQARVVLLKELDHGLIFYSHGLSDKGRALAVHPKASLLFFWDVLDRQIRIEGNVERLDATHTCDYFRQRPRDSQLAALISRQSDAIPNRNALEAAWQAADQQYPDTVPCPADWHGWRLLPQRFEFWQGRPSRLHDRFRYQRKGGRWQITRLAP